MYMRISFWNLQIMYCPVVKVHLLAYFNLVFICCLNLEVVNFMRAEIVSLLY